DNYSTTGSTTLTINPPALTKTIVATSEPSTNIVGGVQQVTIGEVLRYRLGTVLPEGTSTNFPLHDNLPAGLTFLNDRRAKVAFIANGGGISSSSFGAGAGLIPAVSGPGLNFVGNSATGVTPTFVLPDANVSSSATTNNDTY